MAHEIRNVTFPFAQRRQYDREHVQAEVRILAEFLITHHLPQIVIGGCDHPNIDTHGPRAADRLELVFLESTEQLRLKF